jgi:twitching motility protein PilT
MIDFFPAVKQAQIRSVMAGVLRGVVSQRLLPRVGGGRMPAVEVMIVNARIEDLIREGKTEEIPDAIEEGAFYSMQTYSAALIEGVLAGKLDREVAAGAATNRHDFLIALDRALKERAAGTDAPATVEHVEEPIETPDEPEPMPQLRLGAPVSQ